jgi:hypothetical protein
MLRKSQSSFIKYEVVWQNTIRPSSMEIEMIRHGGQWKDRNGITCGNGLVFHFRELIKAIWPWIKFHKWIDLFIESYIEYRTIGALGPASSGKTFDAAVCCLADWYCFSEKTTVIVCSTTREMLENRVWGEIKRLHKSAQESVPTLPGYLIEGRQRLLRDPKMSAVEGRDFRNGLQGVPIKKGDNYQGLGDFAGSKNARVRLIGDELHLLPRVFVDAISNLDKNPDFKAVGLGNPKDTTDALGVFCEPAADLGGWEGGIDQQPGTKSWRTKRPRGICLQFPGTDSPNLDGKLGIPLITQEAMDRDIAFYGKESLWYTMMNLGAMPRGQGARRVLTRQMCLKFQALEEPNWANSNRTRIAALDAAYRGVGGDRCILVFLEFGDEVAPLDPTKVITNLISQSPDQNRGRKIIALTEVLLVPISGIMDPEDQIVKFTMEQCVAHNVPPENFFYDSGMRTSLVQAYARLWATTTNSIDCGGAPSERYVSEDIQVAAKDYYSKKITELWFAVRHIVEARQFRGMTEEVMNEFVQREWTMVGANKIEVEPKEKMKVKTSRSPDLADAVVIGCHGAVHKGFKIMRLGEDRRGPNSDRWKRDLKERASKVHSSGNLKYAA